MRYGKISIRQSLLGSTYTEHILLRRVPVGSAADGAGNPLVALLVARVAHRVVGVPTRRAAQTRNPGPAVGTLEKQQHAF